MVELGPHAADMWVSSLSPPWEDLCVPEMSPEPPPAANARTILLSALEQALGGQGAGNFTSMTRRPRAGEVQHHNRASTA